MIRTCGEDGEDRSDWGEGDEKGNINNNEVVLKVKMLCRTAVDFLIKGHEMTSHDSREVKWKGIDKE